MINYDMHNWVPTKYNTMQQFAEIHPNDPNMYRTYFLQQDTVSNMVRMRAVLNGFMEKFLQQFVSHIQCTLKKSEAEHCS